MRIKPLLGVVILAFALATSSVEAQGPLARMAEVRREIVAGNAARALALLDTLREVAPAHPNLTFLRAHALGAAGRMDDAAREIETLLRWDARFARAALRDTTVSSLRPRFTRVDSLATLAERQVSTAAVWATIDERDLVAEGTAYDPGTRSVLIGSLNKNKVVAIGPDGVVTDRVAPSSHGLRSVVGIHVDSARGTLWIASNARFDTPGDSTASALFEFDSRTGAFRRRHDLPAGQRGNFLNDVTTGPDGSAYVTDSRTGRVWHAPQGTLTMRELTATGPMLAPNGITVSADGQLLFVADADHIRVVHLANGTHWRLAVPDSFIVSGIDGLAFVDGALIAHHPLSFWRVARYEMDAERRRIVSRSIIEANTPDSRTSTTGEIVGGDYVFIGNSQIDRMNLRTIDASTMDPIRIYRIRVRPRS